METVNHPHGNTVAKSSHGAHVGSGGHGGGVGAKVRDPGGFTSRLEHGGSLPGGTKADQGAGTHVQIGKGSV